ncbi:hypothetical protein D3C87_1637450 [compost metagenome]
MLTARTVFDEAFDHHLFLARLDHDGRDFRLSQRLIGFEPTLPTDEVIGRSVTGPAIRRHRNRPLEPDLFDAFDQFAE